MVSDSGLKLCPIKVSFVLTLPFHLGRPSSDDAEDESAGRGILF